MGGGGQNKNTFASLSDATYEFFYCTRNIITIMISSPIYINIHTFYFNTRIARIIFAYTPRDRIDCYILLSSHCVYNRNNNYCCYYFTIISSSRRVCGMVCGQKWNIMLSLFISRFPLFFSQHVSAHLCSFVTWTGIKFTRPTRCTMAVTDQRMCLHELRDILEDLKELEKKYLNFGCNNSIESFVDTSIIYI